MHNYHATVCGSYENYIHLLIMRKDDERLSQRMKGAPAPVMGEGLVWL